MREGIRLRRGGRGCLKHSLLAAVDHLAIVLGDEGVLRPQHGLRVNLLDMYSDSRSLEHYFGLHWQELVPSVEHHGVAREMSDHGLGLGFTQVNLGARCSTDRLDSLGQLLFAFFIQKLSPEVRVFEELYRKGHEVP